MKEIKTARIDLRCTEQFKNLIAAKSKELKVSVNEYMIYAAMCQLPNFEGSINKTQTLKEIEDFEHTNYRIIENKLYNASENHFCEVYFINKIAYIFKVEN